jgi:transposase
MEKLPRQVYTSEFRQQAVEMIARDGLSVAEASRRLSISPKTLANRVVRAKGGGGLEAASAEAGGARRGITEEQAEL